MIRILARGIVAAMAASLLLAATATANAKTCDRDCLKGMVDTYLAAMAKHDPKAAPLAKDLVFTENRQPMKAGEGLWSTLTAVPGDFQIYVPDETTQQVGYLGVLKEGDNPIQLGLRLKVEDGKIVEAEHVVVHRLTERGLANLQKPRAAFAKEVPLPYRDSRSRVRYMAASYYDALAHDNGNLAPFADDCVRRENGMQTTRNPVPDDVNENSFGPFGSMGCTKQLNTLVMGYIDDVGNRRIMVVDEENGLAMGYAHLRHKMAKKRWPVLGVPGIDHRDFDYDPFDNVAMHIFKIWGGEIHEIEALGYRDPYDADSPWPTTEGPGADPQD